MTMKNYHSIQESIFRNPWHFIACGFGFGASPKAPGTFGTIAAIPLYLILIKFNLVVYLSIVVISLLFGIWLCHKTAKDFGVDDHQAIVWDEIVGFWITMICAPSHWPWVILGFVIFRFFDIVKPFPISWCDKHIHGGLGIMLDDVLAGIAALAVLQIVLWVLQI